MSKKKIARILLVLAVVASLTLTALTPLSMVQDASAVTQADIDKLKDELSGMNSEKSQLEKELKSIQNDKSAALAQKENIDKQINLLQSEIKGVESLISEYETLITQTEQELRRGREESAVRAEKERETAGGRAHLAAQERYERLCSAAEMETRKLTLSAKQKVLAETYDRALEILCSMPREEYLSLLVRLLKAAGGKGDEKIALSAKDRDEMGETLVERANRELNAHYTLAGEAADIRAGLVLISKECDVNCSFETLLALSREKTERGAAKLLFAE